MVTCVWTEEIRRRFHLKCLKKKSVPRTADRHNELMGFRDVNMSSPCNSVRPTLEDLEQTAKHANSTSTRSRILTVTAYARFQGRFSFHVAPLKRIAS